MSAMGTGAEAPGAADLNSSVRAKAYLSLCFLCPGGAYSPSHPAPGFSPMSTPISLWIGELREKRDIRRSERCHHGGQPSANGNTEVQASRCGVVVCRRHSVGFWGELSLIARNCSNLDKPPSLSRAPLSPHPLPSVLSPK